ncbi:hypothetical protein EBR96_02220 [bacterium]|nr:hypothetical protein [bacterium]
MHKIRIDQNKNAIARLINKVDAGNTSAIQQLITNSTNPSLLKSELDSIEPYLSPQNQLAVINKNMPGVIKKQILEAISLFNKPGRLIDDISVCLIQFISDNSGDPTPIFTDIIQFLARTQPSDLPTPYLDRLLARAVDIQIKSPKAPFCYHLLFNIVDSAQKQKLIDRLSTLPEPNMNWVGKNPVEAFQRIKTFIEEHNPSLVPLFCRENADCLIELPELISDPRFFERDGLLNKMMKIEGPFSFPLFFLVTHLLNSRHYPQTLSCRYLGKFLLSINAFPDSIVRPYIGLADRMNPDDPASWPSIILKEFVRRLYLVLKHINLETLLPNVGMESLLFIASLHEFSAGFPEILREIRARIDTGLFRCHPSRVRAFYDRGLEFPSSPPELKKMRDLSLENARYLVNACVALNPNLIGDWLVELGNHLLAAQRDWSRATGDSMELYNLMSHILPVLTPEAVYTNPRLIALLKACHDFVPEHLKLTFSVLYQIPYFDFVEDRIIQKKLIDIIQNNAEGSAPNIVRSAALVRLASMQELGPEVFSGCPDRVILGALAVHYHKDAITEVNSRLVRNLSEIIKRALAIGIESQSQLNNFYRVIFDLYPEQPGLGERLAGCPTALFAIVHSTDVEIFRPLQRVVIETALYRMASNGSDLCIDYYDSISAYCTRLMKHSVEASTGIDSLYQTLMPACPSAVVDALRASDRFQFSVFGHRVLQPKVADMKKILLDHLTDIDWDSLDGHQVVANLILYITMLSGRSHNKPGKGANIRAAMRALIAEFPAGTFPDRFFEYASIT